MTQIFFYHNAPDRIAAAVTLITKAFRKKKEILVYAPDAEVASMLDRQLWISSPTGFIPHVYHTSPLSDKTPVLIANSTDSPRQNDRLLNLSDEVPPGFSEFQKIVDVAGQSDEERLAGRERAKFYKAHGCPIEYLDFLENC